MKEATLIFPHQLFEQHPAIREGRHIWLTEESLFFTQYHFHQQKLVLHRASMKYYADRLTKEGHQVQYIDAHNPLHDIRLLIADLKQQHYTNLYFADPVDEWLHKRIVNACQQNQLQFHISNSPNFLNTPEEIDIFFNQRKTYFQTDFYIAQRKSRKLLVNPDEKPIGGKWTFDAANRAKYPKNQQPPNCIFPDENKYVTEALVYVKKHFTNNPGKAGSPFDQTNMHFYPVTHQEAKDWLAQFFQKRFADFGIYEDAMVKNQSILHHSVLTPMLNIGLLNPQYIVQQAFIAAAQHKVPLNSLEGFIRQITGWREFIRAVYMRENVKQRTTAFWGFKRKIPISFWTGTTGILPLDKVIKRVLQTGYAHHIERLMVIGNFMLLCEFDPDEVYRWFMEMFIDSYDWVMVPNVYGMTQFADGGLMTTKPYISGSNYIMKMSDYPKGEWQEVWDALFWRFMHTHRQFFLSNPRLGMLIHTFDKMPKEKQDKHLTTAAIFLSDLSSS